MQQLSVADDLPSVVYVRQKTFLCRWDAGCSTVKLGCSSPNNSKPELDGWDDSSTLHSEDGGFPEPSAIPPRAPRRSFSPPRKTKRQLEATMRSGVDLGSIRLLPVKFAENVDTASAPIMECAATSFSGALELEQFSGKDNQVTAVFCIRRAGCGACREHGLQLTELTRQFQNLNEFGIIKETGVDDKALYDFYADYFNFPIYKDHERDSFRFLGNRKMSVWTLLKAQPKLIRRYHQKGIINIPFGGDIFTRGGVLLFDKAGRLRYIYYERYGDELDMEALTYAIRDCQSSGVTEASFSNNENGGDEPEQPPRLPVRSKSKREDRPARVPKRCYSNIAAAA